MSIRKRTWGVGAKKKTAWVVDYHDGDRKRHLKTFSHKKAAEKWAAKAVVDIGQGTHVPDNASITVTEAGERWLEKASADGLERTTVDHYRQHLRLHIQPFLGNVKLSQLTVPLVSDFRDRLLTGDETLPKADLRREKRSSAMVRGVVRSLGGILSDMQESGRIVSNVVRDLRNKSKRRRSVVKSDRDDRKLEIGVDIPTREEIREFLEATKRIAHGRWRPFMMSAVFTGLRASELRGLRWIDVDLNKGQLDVRQRADRYNRVGAPKSKAGRRTVPLPPDLVRELREWKLVCPKLRDDPNDEHGKWVYVFPNGVGKIENATNIRKRGLVPSMKSAKLLSTEPERDKYGRPKLNKNGRPRLAAKYTGLHCLRHFYASWCINRRDDGGLELPAKNVQELLGHSSIVITMDRYGHLFPRADDTAKLDASARALLGKSERVRLL